MQSIAARIAEEESVKREFVENLVRLLDQGNTIPFLVRYRKEQHGAMEAAQLRRIADRIQALRNLERRKEEIGGALKQQRQLTRSLETALAEAKTLAEAEDLYAPFRPKRRTRAAVARERGLEPLAQAILTLESSRRPEELAAAYVDPDKQVLTPEQALDGARDLIAERIAEDPAIRAYLRERMSREAVCSCRAATEEDSVYRLYYQFSQPARRLQGYQILAMNRGEKEGFLKISLSMDRSAAAAWLSASVRRKGRAPAAERFVAAAAEDAYDRLLAPALERELRAELTRQAQEGAIANFSGNLRQLLMQPPVRGKVTMGLDPGYRNGCKVAVVDPQGKLLDTAVVYPGLGQKQAEQAAQKLEALIRKHRVQCLAIGNGTASGETERLAAEVIRRTGGAEYAVVSEAGASVYSASAPAEEEFPDLDVNLRSAVSIARRLQDPLAELVKIEPRALGVGQYQHDMPEKRLEQALDGVVEDCVNAVGVDVNTASAALLRRVAGLGPVTAKNIVAYREARGPFIRRQQLLKVEKLGPKAYEQCAGFLRVPDSELILDRTGVHPEAYGAAETLLRLCGYTLEDAAAGRLEELAARVEERGAEAVAKACGVGVPTLQDLVKDLTRPGRDPRETLPKSLLRTDALKLEDLRPGMRLRGTVRNVVDFGAFVDVGVHQDGLVHISQMADRYLRHPSEVAAVGDVVMVTVLEADPVKKRLSLSMRDPKEENSGRK